MIRRNERRGPLLQIERPVLRKYYIRPSIGGRQAFVWQSRVIKAGAGAYWCHAAPPPLMALHDPPPSVRCGHVCRLR